MTIARFVLVTVVAGTWLALTPELADAQKKQRDRITREEIEASPHKELDLYQVVRSLRPQFLEPPKGVRSFGNSNAMYTPIALYVDGRRDSGLDALKTLQPMLVEEVRYLDPSRAESEFGPNAANGAVVVKMRKTPKAPAALPPDTTKPPQR